MQRRVVITGCGAVTAAGTELDALWSALMSGECLVKPLKHFSCPEMDGIVGAEVELPAADALPTSIDGDPRRAVRSPMHG